MAETEALWDKAWIRFVQRWGFDPAPWINQALITGEYEITCQDPFVAEFVREALETRPLEAQ